MESRTTAKYQVIQDAGGWRFRFYCDASGALGCDTKVYRGERPEDALAAAWESEGRRQFNRCGRCGRWVINAMYNVDSLQCVDCAPWTARIVFCPACGAKTRKDDAVCFACGADLRGEGGGGTCMRRYCRRTTAQGSTSVRRA